MFNKNGKIYMMKNIWQCCKQIWTHCFFVVSYYRFLNTDPDWACKMWAQTVLRLYTAGLGFFEGLGAYLVK
jgi:hypothetical protein